MTQSLDKTPFRIVEQPRAANKPVKPRRAKVLLTALVLSFAAGIGIVLALDSIDATFRSVDEAERTLGLAVIAAIPEAPALKSSNVLLVTLRPARPKPSARWPHPSRSSDPRKAAALFF